MATILAQALLFALAMQLLPSPLAARPNGIMFAPSLHRSYGNAPPSSNSYGLVDSHRISVSSFDHLPGSFMPDAAREGRYDSSPAAVYSPPAFVDASPSHGRSTSSPALESVPGDLYDGHRPAYDTPQSLLGKSPISYRRNPYDTSAHGLSSSPNSYGSYRQGTVSLEGVSSPVDGDWPEGYINGQIPRGTSPLKDGSAHRISETSPFFRDTSSHRSLPFHNTRNVPAYGRDGLPYEHDLSTRGSGN